MRLDKFFQIDMKFIDDRIIVSRYLLYRPYKFLITDFDNNFIKRFNVYDVPNMLKICFGYNVEYLRSHNQDFGFESIEEYLILDKQD